MEEDDRSKKLSASSDAQEVRRREILKKIARHEAYHIDGGYCYLKTGDYVGESCRRCGRELMIDKTDKAWIFYCHCGHVEEFYRRDRMCEKRYPRQTTQQALDKLNNWKRMK
jgi:hypothetical protein